MTSKRCRDEVVCYLSSLDDTIASQPKSLSVTVSFARFGVVDAIEPGFFVALGAYKQAFSAQKKSRNRLSPRAIVISFASVAVRRADRRRFASLPRLSALRYLTQSPCSNARSARLLITPSRHTPTHRFLPADPP